MKVKRIKMFLGISMCSIAILAMAGISAINVFSSSNNNQQMVENTKEEVIPLAKTADEEEDIDETDEWDYELGEAITPTLSE